MSNSYRVGVEPLTNQICIGRVNKKGNLWIKGTKRDATAETLGAVVQHVLNHGQPVELTSSRPDLPDYEISVIEVYK